MRRITRRTGDKGRIRPRRPDASAPGGMCRRRFLRRLVLVAGALVVPWTGRGAESPPVDRPARRKAKYFRRLAG